MIPTAILLLHCCAKAELDAGPIIKQNVVRTIHKDTSLDFVFIRCDLKNVLVRVVKKHIEREILTCFGDCCRCYNRMDDCLTYEDSDVICLFCLRTRGW